MAIGTINGINSNNSNNAFELSLSTYNLLLDKNEATTVTVTTPSNGQIYATSSNATVATASINNNVITINTLAYGSTIITVAQATGTGDYSSITPEIKSILLICQRNIEALDDTEWSVISEIAQEGTGSSYWSVGDMKGITLNGTIGTLSLSNFETNVFILHFNYPIDDVAENNIIMQGFKTSNGIAVGIIDQYYGTKQQENGVLAFNISHYGQSWGSWSDCDFRYDILGATSTSPSGYGSASTTARTGYDATSATFTNPVPNTLLAALPNEFRSALRLYKRNIRAATTAPATMAVDTSTVIDAISLLMGREVYWYPEYDSTAINNNDLDHYITDYNRDQMDYFAAGNSYDSDGSFQPNDRIRHKAHTNTNTVIIYWLVDSNIKSTGSWHGSAGDSKTYVMHETKRPYMSYGLVPIFKF